MLLHDENLTKTEYPLVWKKRALYFLAFLLFLAVEVFIALFVHDRFIRPYIGDVLVVVVLYCLVRIFLPQGCRWLPIILFIFATGVEFLQYLNIVEWLHLSGNIFMRILIGSVFDVKDIICYGVGCATLQILELHKSIFPDNRHN